MPADYAAYVAEVLAAAPEEKREALRSALTDDSVIGKLKEGFLRQSDYSRSKDEIAAKQKEVDAFVAEQVKNVDGWKQYSEDAIRTAAEHKELVDKYKATYGELAAGGNTPGVGGMKKEDIEAMLQSHLAKERGSFSNWTVDAIEKIVDLKTSHAKNFGTNLSTKDLTDFAAKHNIADLNIAYNAFVEPQMEAKREESFKAKMAEAVKQAKEDAKREAIAERFPAGGGSRTLFPEASKDAILPDRNDRIRSAAADLETALAGMR